MSSSPVPPESRPHSTTPERAKALADCRGALDAYSGDPHAFDRVRAAIHALAVVARADRVSPEQMLIELKPVIADAPAMRAMPSAQAEATRARLVSVAIRAYYGEPPA